MNNKIVEIVLLEVSNFVAINGMELPQIVSNKPHVFKVSRAQGMRLHVTSECLKKRRGRGRGWKIWVWIPNSPTNYLNT